MPENRKFQQIPSEVIKYYRLSHSDEPQDRIARGCHQRSCVPAGPVDGTRDKCMCNPVAVDHQWTRLELNRVIPRLSMKVLPWNEFDPPGGFIETHNMCQLTILHDWRVRSSKNAQPTGVLRMESIAAEKGSVDDKSVIAAPGHIGDRCNISWCEHEVEAIGDPEDRHAKFAVDINDGRVRPVRRIRRDKALRGQG